MPDLLLLAIHLLVTLAKLLGPGGVRRVAAESGLLKHQLLISNRTRQRAPNLTTLDRVVLGLTTLFVSPHRIPKLSTILKPTTLFKFRKALVQGKYRLLFSSCIGSRRHDPHGLPVLARRCSANTPVRAAAGLIGIELDLVADDVAAGWFVTSNCAADRFSASAEPQR